MTKIVPEKKLQIIFDSVLPDELKDNNPLIYDMFMIYLGEIDDIYDLGNNPGMLLDFLNDQEKENIDLEAFKQEQLKMTVYTLFTTLTEYSENAEVRDIAEKNAAQTPGYELTDETFNITNVITDDTIVSSKEFAQIKGKPYSFEYLSNILQEMEMIKVISFFAPYFYEFKNQLTIRPIIVTINNPQAEVERLRPNVYAQYTGVDDGRGIVTSVDASNKVYIDIINGTTTAEVTPSFKIDYSELQDGSDIVEYFVTSEIEQDTFSYEIYGGMHDSVYEQIMLPILHPVGFRAIFHRILKVVLEDIFNGHYLLKDFEIIIECLTSDTGIHFLDTDVDHDSFEETPLQVEGEIINVTKFNTTATNTQSYNGQVIKRVVSDEFKNTYIYADINESVLIETFPGETCKLIVQYKTEIVYDYEDSFTHTNQEHVLVPDTFSREYEGEETLYGMKIGRFKIGKKWQDNDTAIMARNVNEDVKQYPDQKVGGYSKPILVYKYSKEKVTDEMTFVTGTNLP